MGDRLLKQAEQYKYLSSCKDIVAHLYDSPFDYEKYYQEWQLSHRVTARDIKKMIHLPYECMLQGSKGKLLFRAAGFIDRDNTLLSFHTHASSEDKVLVPYPSFTDMFLTFNLPPNTTHILAHENGMVMYQRPQIDPINQEPISMKKHIRVVMTDFMVQKYSVHFYSDETLTIEGKVCKSYFNLSFEERTAIANDFAVSSGMIVKEASWSDKATISEMVNLLNSPVFFNK